MAEFVFVNWKKQNRQKNILWSDFPCINPKTNRPLKNNLGYYFSTWEQYLKTGGQLPTNPNDIWECSGLKCEYCTHYKTNIIKSRCEHHKKLLKKYEEKRLTF